MILGGFDSLFFFPIEISGFLSQVKKVFKDVKDLMVCCIGTVEKIF